MSAPEVGDRVRVIAGPWRGWEGVVSATVGDHCVVDLIEPTTGLVYTRPLHVSEVEKVPETRENRPRSDRGADPVPVEGRDADGARRGAER